MARKCKHCGSSNPKGSKFCNGCGSALDVPAPFDGLLPDGTVLRNTYVVERVVGEGGMGVVYAARHKALGSRFAIKVLDSKLARLSTLRDRFLEEARIQATLHHINIVRVHDILDEGGVFGMVMEYIEGLTLDSYIHDERGQLGFDEARSITLALLDGIGHAHRAGVIHRDIKPSNILLTQRHTPTDVATHVKVMDFGIAKVLDTTSRTVTGAKMGTPRYMAPEQVKNARDVDNRTDIYAVGLTIYEMICGKSPFEDLRDYDLLKAQIEEAPPALSTYRPDTPPALEEVILTALAKNPDDRYADAAAFMQALTALGDLPNDAPATALKTETPTKTKAKAKAKPKPKPAKLRPAPAPTTDPLASEPPAELSNPSGEWELGDTSLSQEDHYDDEREPGSHRWLWIGVLLVLLVVGGAAYRALGPPSQAATEPREQLTEEQVQGGERRQGTNTSAGDTKRRSNAAVQTLATPTAKMSLLEAGTYPVGRVAGDALAKADEAAPGTLVTGAIYIDQTEVPQSRYAACVAEEMCPPLVDAKKRSSNLPVTGIGYGSAEAFCAWAGKRLPTEQEWEAAARGGSAQVYPTPKAPDCWQANYGGGSGAACAGTNNGEPVSVYTQELNKTRLHLRHVAGNVWEWTSIAGSDAQTRIAKGGSAMSDLGSLRVSARRLVKANTGASDVGFRCVMDAD